VEEERAGEGEAETEVSRGLMLSSLLSSGGGEAAFRLETAGVRLVAERDRV
jgi:hypothetical protein